jgi:hypothetical protein
LAQSNREVHELSTLRNRQCTDASPTAVWPLDRILFALAGSVTLLGVTLGATVSLWFLLLPAFVGLNQWLYVLKGDCPASFVLKRLGVRGSWAEPRQQGTVQT